MRKPKGYWNIYDNVLNEALKYKSKKVFQEKASVAYKYSRMNGWYEDVTKHMTNPHFKWDIDSITREGLKYTSRKEFKEKSEYVYKLALKYNIIDNISHKLKSNIIKSNFWTKDNCQNEANKYKNRTDFNKKSPNAYKIACKNSWMDDICKHMITIGDLYKRCIYVAIFSDNSAYIGLTSDIERRKYEHINDSKKKSPIFIHINKINEIPIFIQLTEYINIQDAKEAESNFLLYYTEKKYTILNIAKTGGIGGVLSNWTYENCKNEALKYTVYKEFAEKSHAAYTMSVRKNWIFEITTHMKIRKSEKYLNWLKNLEYQICD